MLRDFTVYVRYNLSRFFLTVFLNRTKSRHAVASVWSWSLHWQLCQKNPWKISDGLVCFWVWHTYSRQTIYSLTLTNCLPTLHPTSVDCALCFGCTVSCQWTVVENKHDCFSALLWMMDWADWHREKTQLLVFPSVMLRNNHVYEISDNFWPCIYNLYI